MMFRHLQATGNAVELLINIDVISVMFSLHSPEVRTNLRITLGIVSIMNLKCRPYDYKFFYSDLIHGPNSGQSVKQ